MKCVTRDEGNLICMSPTSHVPSVKIEIPGEAIIASAGSPKASFIVISRHYNGCKADGCFANLCTILAPAFFSVTKKLYRLSDSKGKRIWD